jgi:glycolate oxidase FAD binding subunit
MTKLADTVTSRLAEIAAAENVLGASAALSAYQVDGLVPGAAVRPSSAEEIAGVLRFAAAEDLAVIPMGGRTKLDIGMPPRRYDVALDTSRMNRVLAYDPGDLTLGVEPGVVFAQVADLLGESRQFLPLAPALPERATIGGIVAAGCDSPLRPGYGTARDFLLGIEFVTGAGVASKSGGRVVKNVTGYDLHKLLVGSLGTLAVITRLNFRTFPVPPEHRTFLAWFLDASGALGYCARLAKSQMQPRMIEVLNPASVATLTETPASRDDDSHWAAAISVAGHTAAVERHARELERLARQAEAKDFEALPEPQADDLLRHIADFSPIILRTCPGAAIFRIAVLPSAMLALLDQISAAASRAALDIAVLVRAAGVVYAALLPGSGDTVTQKQIAAACREVMSLSITAGARPMIESCPLGLKHEMSVWPAAGNEQIIALRLKNVFDPRGILAPGRFQGGL